MSESKPSRLGRGWDTVYPLTQWQHMPQHPPFRQGILSPLPHLPLQLQVVTAETGTMQTVLGEPWILEHSGTEIKSGTHFPQAHFIIPGGSQVSKLIIPKGGATCPDPNYTMCLHLFPIKQLQVPELCILSETMCWVIFKYYLQNTYECCQETINYKLPPVPRATTWLLSPCKSLT